MPLGLPEYPGKYVRVYTSGAASSGIGWQTWEKPPWASMIHMMIVGAGGSGGNGAVGAAGSAAGGGGGSSGCQTMMLIPAHGLPDKLFLSVPSWRPAAGTGTTIISAYPDASIVAAHTIGHANAGTNGANASAGSAGGGGSAGSASVAANMPLGWGFVTSAIASQVGANGGTGAGTPSLAFPVTGIHVMAGTGGGACPISGNGQPGGSVTTPSMPSPFPVHGGGFGGFATTAPPGFGNSGLDVKGAGKWLYGATGGGGTHSGAVTTGLVGANGGDGAPGCGGGGGGGARTGSTQGLGGIGGGGLVVITCW